MNHLDVTLIQSDLYWLDINANLEAFSSKISTIQGSTDLVLLPEMFSTGFTMDPQNPAEEMEGPTMSWMAEQAQKVNAVIAGSLVVVDRGQYYNRFVWMYPGGMYHTYDKRHLFAMAGEHEKYTAGEERLIVNYKGWRICPLICYDLRFPVWSRNDHAFDVLIFVANWPNKRMYDWNTLLRARAIENQCYVIGVNRIGTDPNGHEYNGDSCVIDPGWNQVIYHTEKIEAVHTVSLSKDHLTEVRNKLPFLKDQDRFAVL